MLQYAKLCYPKGMISYPNYKFSFTIWALGRYATVWGDKAIRN